MSVSFRRSQCRGPQYHLTSSRFRPSPRRFFDLRSRLPFQSISAHRGCHRPVVPASSFFCRSSRFRVVTVPGIGLRFVLPSAACFFTSRTPHTRKPSGWNCRILYSQQLGDIRERDKLRDEVEPGPSFMIGPPRPTRGRHSSVRGAERGLSAPLCRPGSHRPRPREHPRERQSGVGCLGSGNAASVQRSGVTLATRVGGLASGRRLCRYRPCCSCSGGGKRFRPVPSAALTELTGRKGRRGPESG